MKKKEYEQPTIDVVELRVMNQLLAGSVTDRPDYVDGGDPFTPAP
jgi:hypothetical protein